jgi:hypothetical protein
MSTGYIGLRRPRAASRMPGIAARIATTVAVSRRVHRMTTAKTIAKHNTATMMPRPAGDGPTVESAHGRQSMRQGSYSPWLSLTFARVGRLTSRRVIGGWFVDAGVVC